MIRKLAFCLIFSLFATQALMADETTTSTESTSTTSELTPAEKELADNYLHQGLSQRTMEEECNKLSDSRACQGNGKTSFLGISSNTITMVAKASSIVLGLINRTDDGKVTKLKKVDMKDANGNVMKDANGKVKKTTEEDGTREDYCSYVAIATETIGMFMQNSASQTMQAEAAANQNESQQRQLLYQASRSHDIRSKAAQLQAAGWGTTAACYTYYVYQAKVTGSIQSSWSLYAKLGASAFLTSFYVSEAKAQKTYSSEVRKIANKLPDKGDCNPVTDNACYCAQPETMYDSTYCLGSVASTGYTVPCVDQNLNSDPTCACKTTNTCFDQSTLSGVDDDTLKQFLNSSSGIDLSSLGNGTLTSGESLSDTEGKATQLTSLTNSLADTLKAPTGTDLTDLDASEAKTLSTYGLNTKASGILASSTSKVDASKIANLSKSLATPVNVGKISKTSLSGKGADIETKKDSGSQVNFNFLKNYGKNQGSRSPSSKLLEFAQKAQQEAEVSKDTSKPIWESISHRYQDSGWDRLKVND